jgi:hypothetical protein
MSFTASIGRSLFLCLLLVICSAAPAFADTILGSFAGGTAENGWGRWNDPISGFNNGLPGTNVSVSGDTSTDGDGFSAKIDHAGNVQSLAYSAGTAGTIADFMANNFLVFDLVYAGIPTDPQGGGFNELWEVVLNSQYGGFTAFGGANQSINPGTGYFEGWGDGQSGARSHLNIALDYRSIKQAWLDNGTPGWVELIFAVQGSNRDVKYIDNVRLVVPEPASFVLMSLVPVALLAVRRRRMA